MVYIGLGSNKGDRAGILDEALSALSAHISALRVSALYRTEPIGGVAQNDFLNAVACGDYRGSAFDLLSLCHRIERAAGRDRSEEVRFGPRTLDLDILLFHDSVIDSDTLVIPHPRMHERRFVLVPILELSPQIVDPRSGRSFAEQLRQLPQQGIYYYGNPKIYY